MKRVIAIILALALGSVVGTEVYAVCRQSSAPLGFYVSPTGSDSNVGTLIAPFATLTRAQAAMRVGGAPKITYIRGGNYTAAQIASPAITSCDGDGVPCILDLQAADASTTWSYYPPDGYDSAIIDGGSTGVGVGMFYMINVHVAGVTINGLSLQNFQYAAVHSGSGPDKLTISNNDLGHGTITTTNTAPGAISCFNCTNLTVSHNYIHDIGAWGINLAATPTGNASGMTVDGNFIQSTCTGRSDCAAVYIVDATLQATTGTTWTNNYVRDGNTFATLGSGFGSAFYADDCASNVQMIGNVVAGRNGSNNAMLFHGGKNVVVNNNLVDISTFQQHVFSTQTTTCPDNTMSGNTFKNNIVIGTGPGGGLNNLSGSVPTPPAVSNNDYFPYGDGAISSTGNWTDSAPSTVNPQLSGWSYVVAASSPVLSAPVSFLDLCRTWGPPGFVIPQTGTPPSSPLTGSMVATNLTNGTVLTSSSVVTAAISPAVNKLDIVSVAGKSGVATDNIPTVTGAGGTWVQISTQIDVTNLRRITLFRDLSGAPGSGALTIDFAAQQQSDVEYSIDEFGPVNPTGTHGSGAIVQSPTGTSSATNTGFTVTLATLGSTNNGAFGFIRTNGSNAVSPGPGFSDLSNQSSSSRVDAEAATNQTAVAWTWVSQNVISVAGALEIKAP